MKTIELAGYVIRELTVGDMRKIQKESNGEDVQYAIASLTISKDGNPIGIDELEKLPISIGNKLMLAVADINVHDGDEGNG